LTTSPPREILAKRLRQATARARLRIGQYWTEGQSVGADFGAFFRGAEEGNDGKHSNRRSA